MTVETRALHGTNSRFALGCRCIACYDARAAYMRAYRARRKVYDIELNGQVVGQMVEEVHE